jgi:hypothetical protein
MPYNLKDILALFGGENPPPAAAPFDQQAALNRLMANDPNYPWKDNTLPPTGPAPSSGPPPAAAQSPAFEHPFLPFLNVQQQAQNPEAANTPPMATSMPFFMPSPRMQKGSKAMLQQASDAVAPGLKLLAGGANKMIGGDISQADDPSPSAAEILSKATPGPSMSAQGMPMPQAEQGLLARLNAERGGSLADLEMAKHQGFGEVVRGVENDFEGLVRSHAQEAAKNGVNTPEKADNYLRMEFKDDPYLEGVLQEAKSRYADARAESGKTPGITDYLGYALLMLGGAHPLQAAEMISRRGEKMRNEQGALNDVMQLEGAKIKDRQEQRRLGESEYRQLQMLMGQQAREQQKEQRVDQSKAQEFQFQRLKSGRGAALQQLNALRQQYPAPLKAPPEVMQQMQQLQKRIEYFNKQLGEPGNNEVGVSPDVARMLGLG